MVTRTPHNGALFVGDCTDEGYTASLAVFPQFSQLHRRVLPVQHTHDKSPHLSRAVRKGAVRGATASALAR